MRGDHDDGLARCRQIIDDAVDLVLGADVDTTGRLVQNQDIRLGEHPLGQQDLLLVAAGKISDQLFDRRCLGLQLVTVLLRDLVLTVLVDHHVVGKAVQIGEGCVDLDGLGKDQPVSFTVFRNIGDLVFDGVRGALLEGDRLAVDL